MVSKYCPEVNLEAPSLEDIHKQPGFPFSRRYLVFQYYFGLYGEKLKSDDPGAVNVLWMALKVRAKDLVRLFETEPTTPQWRRQSSALGLVFGDMEKVFPVDVLFDERLASWMVNSYIWLGSKLID